MVKRGSKLMKKISYNYLYVIFFLLMVVVFWFMTRREGLETNEDGSGCLVTDTDAEGIDSSFNVSVSCEQFKEVLMGSSLDEFSSL